MVAAAALALTACSVLQEDDVNGNVTITLPNAGGRSISAGDIGRLERATASYRVHMNDRVLEGSGGRFSAYFAVGLRVDIYVECLNSSRDVIVRTGVKSIVVGSGQNIVDINLKNDGNEIIPPAPQPVPNQVTYDWGEASKHGTKNGLPSSITVEKGEIFTVDDGTNMTWQHATDSLPGFAGWSASPAIEPENGGQAESLPTPGQKYKMPDGGVVLTARWNKNTYQIRYNANEPENAQGTKATVTGVQQQATSVTALDNATAATAPTISNPFDSKNWTFTGWNTQAGGGGTTYSAGQQITMVTDHIDLYAKWTDKNVFTVTYNMGSGGPSSAGSGWRPSDTYIEGSATGITLPTLTATGYDFVGWQTDTGTPITSPYVPTAGITLYAQWSIKTYSITYNPDGGNVNPSSGATEFDVRTGSINLPQADGKTGYRLDYWKAADGTNVTGMGGEQLAALVPSGSTTLALTAVWREETYNIAYTVASGEGTGTVSASFTITQNGGQVTLNGGTAGFTRSGYRIASWKYDDGSTAGNAGAQVSASALIAKADAGSSTSLQLTAVWTPIQYTITYNANGGGNNPASTPFTVADGTVTLDTGSSLSKAGYTFAGWSTQQNGTAITDTSAQALIGLMSGSNTSITLYAVWQGDLKSAPSVGDIIMSDGTVKTTTDTINTADAIAVVYKVESGKAWAVGKTHATLKWADKTLSPAPEGYNKLLTSLVTEIDGVLGNHTFSGVYTDGSTGFDKLLSEISDYNDNPDRYPAWKWINSYGTSNASSYSAGWYFPSVNELYEIFQANKTSDIINTALTKAGGTSFGTAYYFSSSQRISYSDRGNGSISSDSYTMSCYTDFSDGSCGGSDRSVERNVCAVRVFTY